MSLSLETLQKIIRQMEQAQEDLEKFPQIETIRAGVVKCFEYTYEISRKVLLRALNEEDATKYTLGEDLFRKAREKGIIKGDNEDWHRYRTLRNQTSHEYGIKKTQEIIDIVPEFLLEIKFLEEQLRQRINQRSL